MSAMALSPTVRINRIHGRSAVVTAIKISCIVITLLFVGLLLVMPLVSVFYQAFASGWDAYKAAILDPNSLHAVKMTLLVAVFAVPLNTIFGVAAAWAIAKFEFRGKALLTTIIDLPFAISPVISGMIFVLLFGRQGLLAKYLYYPSFHWRGFSEYVAQSSAASWWPSVSVAHHLWPFATTWESYQIIFALPGMILATIFVTFPFVARELIPLMQEQGSLEEQAAISLGASGWQTFWRITLPNIKWGVLYGVILCNARAMGEFGALSVVTQNISGETNTLPREIEYAYSTYDGLGIQGAFALASLLAMLGLVTLIAKSLLEWKLKRDLLASKESD